ncbi:MAG TPA: hypothetical protein PKA27_16370 [Fimbriimonadaceae bacterium]|nr:hypothetical protein [Fimbriimonadaceae bacterium]
MRTVKLHYILTVRRCFNPAAHSVMQTGSGNTTSTYDADGLRRTKRTATAFTTFVWGW